MRKEKLGFGVILRAFISLLPLMFGMPVLAVITCAYNIVMNFIVFGALSAVVSSLCTACIAMVMGEAMGMSGVLSGLALSVEATLAAAGCIYGYLFKKKFSQGLCLTTAGVLVPMFLLSWYQSSSLGLSVSEAMIPGAEEIESQVTMSLGTVASSVPPEIIKQVSLLTVKMAEIMLPSVLIITSLLLGYVIMWAISAQMKRLPFGIRHSFSEIRLPKITVVITIVLLAALIGMIAVPSIKFPEAVFAVVLNMFLILYAVLLFSGISAFEFYLRKIVKLAFFRIIIHILIISFVPFILLIYPLLACLDSFLDFRKLPSADFSKDGETDETEK